MSKSVFQSSWLNEANLASWLRPVKQDPYSAYCLACRRTFSLSSMGKQAVTSHAKYKNHQSSVLQMSTQPKMNTFTAPLFVDTTLPVAAVANVSDAGTSGTSAQVVVPLNTISARETTIPQPCSFASNEDITKAEVLWCLHSVENHFSYNSSKSLCSILRAMDPKSEILQKISLSPAKLSYIISFGLAPYVSDLLLSEIKDAGIFVVIFDEAFNKVSKLRAKQTCMYIRLIGKCKYLSRP